MSTATPPVPSPQVAARLAEGFQVAGQVDDVPWLEGRTVTIGEDQVAIFHTEEGFTAIGAACPHARGPLADGILSDRCVTCPLHSWQIDVRTGEVVSGGEGRVPVYELVREGDTLLVRPGAAA